MFALDRWTTSYFAGGEVLEEVHADKRTMILPSANRTRTKQYYDKYPYQRIQHYVFYKVGFHIEVDILKKVFPVHLLAYYHVWDI